MLEVPHNPLNQVWPIFTKVPVKYRTLYLATCQLTPNDHCPQTITSHFRTRQILTLTPFCLTQRKTDTVLLFLSPPQAHSLSKHLPVLQEERHHYHRKEPTFRHMFPPLQVPPFIHALWPLHHVASQIAAYLELLHEKP